MGMALPAQEGGHCNWGGGGKSKVASSNGSERKESIILIPCYGK